MEIISMNSYFETGKGLNILVFIEQRSLLTEGFINNLVKLK
jgi:hypothetical protein